MGHILGRVDNQCVTTVGSTPNRSVLVDIATGLPMMWRCGCAMCGVRRSIYVEVGLCGYR